MRDGEGRRRLSAGWRSRRQFLAATAGLATGALAGCSSVTDQEFAAAPVVLPGEAQEELSVTEAVRDSATISQDVEQVDGEITITNQFSAYARGPDRGSFEPTLIERFIGQVNGTESGGAATVVPGDALMDLEGADYDGLADFVGSNYQGLMDFIGQDYLGSVTADRISLVAPAGLRSEEAGRRSVLLLPTAESDELEPPSGQPLQLVEMQDFFPSNYWFDRGQEYQPSAAWLPVGTPPSGWLPAGVVPGGFLPTRDFAPDTPVAVTLGDSTPEEVFGIPEAEMPGERIEAGDAEQPISPFLVAAPGGVPLDGQSPVAERYKNFFDAGVPAPTSATYRVGVLSTPAAEVAGEAANPLARLGFGDLLKGSEFMARPKETFLGDGVGEWLSGPDSLAEVRGDGADSSSATAITGQDTDIEGFVGVVSGDHGPLGLGVHAARVRREGDVVIVAGVHSWPVGSSNYFHGLGERFWTSLSSVLGEARGLTDAAGRRLVVEET